MDALKVDCEAAMVSFVDLKADQERGRKYAYGRGDTPTARPGAG